MESPPGVADEWCKLLAVPQGNYRAAMQDDAVKKLRELLCRSRFMIRDFLNVSEK
jgi:hypothetical protein